VEVELLDCGRFYAEKELRDVFDMPMKVTIPNFSKKIKTMNCLSKNK